MTKKHYDKDIECLIIVFQFNALECSGGNDVVVQACTVWESTAPCQYAL